MPRLRILSAREVCKILERHSFQQVRQSDSHIIMQLQLPDCRITVPIPNHSRDRPRNAEKHR